MRSTPWAVPATVPDPFFPNALMAKQATASQTPASNNSRLRLLGNSLLVTLLAHWCGCKYKSRITWAVRVPPTTLTISGLAFDRQEESKSWSLGCLSSKAGTTLDGG